MIPFDFDKYIYIYTDLPRRTGSTRVARVRRNDFRVVAADPVERNSRTAGRTLRRRRRQSSRAGSESSPSSPPTTVALTAARRNRYVYARIVRTTGFAPYTLRRRRVRAACTCYTDFGVSHLSISCRTVRVTTDLEPTIRRRRQNDFRTGRRFSLARLMFDVSVTVRGVALIRRFRVLSNASTTKRRLPIVNKSFVIQHHSEYL